MKALVLTLLFLLMASSEAKVFSRCELASILKEHGMDRYPGELDRWICLIYYASKYNTKAVTGPDKHLLSSYGIFQIGSDRWCSDNYSGPLNICGKPCSDFTDDDITDDIACAKTIEKNYVRLRNWWPWFKNCRKKYITKWSSDCNL